MRIWVASLSPVSTSTAKYEPTNSGLSRGSAFCSWSSTRPILASRDGTSNVDRGSRLKLRHAFRDFDRSVDPSLVQLRKKIVPIARPLNWSRGESTLGTEGRSSDLDKSSGHAARSLKRAGCGCGGSFGASDRVRNPNFHGEHSAEENAETTPRLRLYRLFSQWPILFALRWSGDADGNERGRAT